MKAVDCCEPFFSNVVVVVVVVAPKNLPHHEQRLRNLGPLELLKGTSCAFARFYEHIEIYRDFLVHSLYRL
jgi:hypothetical protein